MKGEIDLNLLVTFDAIYRSRNLTVAGRKLGLTQPAMSHALARLRTAFDDPLFVRLQAGLQPTALAEEIAPELSRGLAIVRGLLERRAFDPATSTRVFRVRMGDIAETVHLPRLLRELERQAPHARLQSVALPEASLGDALAAGDIDLAAGNYDLGVGFRETLLFTGDYACIARQGHSVVGSKLTLQTFRGAEHVRITPKGVSPKADVVGKALGSRKVGATVAAEVSSFYALLAMVASTDLLATIPRQLAVSMQTLAGVRVFEPPFALPRLKVSLYWSERFHREPANVWLRRLYAGLFRDS